MIQQMNEGTPAFAFNPQSPYSTPFTIISQAKEIFTSKPIATPCLYEVYCPYSCKKIKIGLTKDNKIQALEFNTTTNRTVSFYANENIRYLINKHRPNKKDKKVVNGQGWASSIEVEDKGNIAIFNPYCLDPLQPLSFYTFEKIGPNELPTEKLNFAPKAERETVSLRLGQKTVYLSKDLKWIGLNPYFDEPSSQKITILNPQNRQQELTMSTSCLVSLAVSYLNHYFGELQKMIELQTKGIQFNDQLKVNENVDTIYEQISIYLNILEQVRARLMNNDCTEAYKKLFKEHPRLYSSISRLASFLNYGNSKYNTVKLAELGFYNRSDMLQDLAFVELPDQQIPSAEEQSIKDQTQLRNQLFPFSRSARNLPFPNVDLNTALVSMHSQLTTSSQIVSHCSLDPYISFVDKDTKVSMWSCEMMVHKLFQFDISHNLPGDSLKIPTTLADKAEFHAQKGEFKQQPIKSEQAQLPQKTKEQEAKHDESTLQILQSMGFQTGLAKKAMLEAKSQDIEVIIDLYQKMAAESAPKKAPSKQWNCNQCTFKNKANVLKCQMCEAFAPEEEEDQQALLKVLQAERKLQKQKKQKQQEQQQKRQQEEQRKKQEEQKQQQRKLAQQKRSQMKKIEIISSAMHKLADRNIDPFLISILYKLNGKYYVKTLRIGLKRASLLKFYRIEDDLIICNFNRKILNVKDFAAINELIGECREQIQWGIRFFQSAEQKIWTVVNNYEIQLDGLTPTKISFHKDNLIVQQNSEKAFSYAIKVQDTLAQPKLKFDRQEEPVKNLEQEQIKMEIEPIDKILSRVQASQNEIIVGEKVEDVYLQLVEHLPAGQWKNIARDKDAKISGSIYAQNLIMSQFLPLKIETYEGSIFSHKYSCASMLQKSSDKNNIYVSNYPNVNFSFKSIDNKPIFIESVSIVSKNVKMNKIYPISAGLIFTANQLSWFGVAKQKFSNFTKNDYDEWLKYKQVSGQTVGFWEPVAYFDLNNQAEFEINSKRVAKYVFLLPTVINKKQNNDDVVAVKIDFFGVKGRVEQQLPEPQLYEEYKNDGFSDSKLQLSEQFEGKSWKKLDFERVLIKTAVSANTINFAPKYFETFSNKIPLSTTTLFKIKFKNVQSQKRLAVNSPYMKSLRVLSTKQTTSSPQKLNIGTFTDLIGVHNKLSNAQIEHILSKLNLKQLVLELLKGPAELTKYENLLTKILTFPDSDKKVLDVMSGILIIICETDIEVNDLGFKSFIRFYEKVILIDEKVSKETIEKCWTNVMQFCQKCRNKNYNILRNTYKIEELVLQPGLFSKDYYRLINPSYVQQQKPASITTEPQTPINNRVFIHPITDFHYLYYVDLLGHEGLQSVDLYFPKIAGDQRYKMTIRITELTQQEGRLTEKQVYYRYFHEDYLLQLSQKAFRDTEIFTKTQINYCSIPGSLISPGTRILKIYFSLLILTTIPSAKVKPLLNPYIMLPIVVSSKKEELKYAEHPLTGALHTLFSQYPESTKHNSTLERMPPHRYSHENKRLLYVVHELKSKANSSEIKTESINKIEKLVQNILDKTIVTETVAGIKINDFVLNYKGLDFAYILMITLYKMFRKLPVTCNVDVKLMFMLFDAFIVYEHGPIKNQTTSILIELYNRLNMSDRSYFVQEIVDNYLIDMEKIRTLKISEKYPSQKIIKLLNELNLPITALFEKLRTSTSLSSITILAILISNNKPATNFFSDLNLYKGDDVVRAYAPHELIEITFKKCNWIIDNTSGLSTEILEIGLNLLLLFLTESTSGVSYKVNAQQIKKFAENLSQEDFWRLVFGILKKRNDTLNDKIDLIFKILVQNMAESFQKGINNMLLQIIKNDRDSLYEKINRNVSDDVRMSHLKTILEYLSLTNKKVFLDTKTAISLLQLPLTTTLWSLALKIIPREDEILTQIIKKFSQELYNSLGNEIMEFCEPLAGIKKLESNHINWLDLVKKIRLENRSIFELFIEHLGSCNFGGRNGVTMALPSDAIKLEIADEFAKLVSENKIQEKGFNEQNIKILTSWFFMNYTKEKGSSPATDLLTSLSKNVLTIFQKIAGSPSVIPKFIKVILDIRKEGETIENLFELKRVSSSNAIDLNRRFSQCFQLLINLLCVNDELFNYFSFDIGGLQYLLEKSGLSSEKLQQIKQEEGAVVLNHKIPEQEYLISEGLITSSAKDANPAADKASNSIELKQEEFATNVQLVPSKNQHSVTSSNVDWTIYKKANKTKIIFLPMTGPTFYQFPLFVSFTNSCEVRSIKIGFPAASYEIADKLVAAPSSVLLEGGMDLKNMETIGEMERLEDDGYTCNGVVVFVLNLQKIKKNVLNIEDALAGLTCFRVKFLKIVVKRPTVSFIEGQYSPLNGKPYTNLGSSICFLSVLGDNLQKIKPILLNHCKEISKSSALTILGTVINESNSQTVQRISHSEQFVANFKNKFDVVQDHMKNYPTIVPNIVFSLGSSNEQLGDWLIAKFLSEGNGDVQAKLLNQIVMSSSKRIYLRLDIFLGHILQKIKQIVNESDIEANIKYSESLYFIESFCKTLQESYEFGIEKPTRLQCRFENIQDIITLYDRKYSSPEIKTFTRLLIILLYLRAPLTLSQNVREKALNLIWQNCSEAKPYFYDLLGALLLNKKNNDWIQQNQHEKIKGLVAAINKSIESNSQKTLGPQLFLLWILSFHEREYILSQSIHLQIYNKVKVLTVPSFQIYDYVIKIVQNVVLDSEEHQKIIAEQLIEDVDLLVKRKDHNLQQLYVGMLRLEKEVNVNIKGFDVDSRNSKKDALLTSKILNKVHVKLLTQKIHKKIKFNLVYESDLKSKGQLYDKIYGAMNGSQFLMAFRLKLANGKYGYIGCYSPGRSFRSEEDSYCWEDVINYEKGAFIFYICEGETKFIESTETQGTEQMLSLFGGQDQSDQSVILYEKSSQIFKISLKNLNQTNIKLPVFQGAKIQWLQIFNGCLKPSTMEPRILASSSKAGNPFIYYRTSSIFIFPYRITMDKFMNIIGIKGKCKKWSKSISPDEILGAVGQQSDDFIADISIQVEDSEDTAKQEEGYFPIMKIFDKFSDLGGVNKVLQIGSKSIKDWSKPERRKCFEHYMSELKNFVHLPNFFNHYIKNQQSITFLFEVASGMPDDPNSEKNWEQEEVKSSKFIYKILADIYKYDKSPQLRDMGKYSQFCELILQKLAEISKETVRTCKENQPEAAEPNAIEGQKEKSSVVNLDKKKKKGTGYSSDNQNSSKWTAGQWIEYRKNMNEEIQRVASIFVSFLDCDKPLTDPLLAEIIKNSCLLPLIESALRSGSLLDISKEADLFRSYLNIIKSMASNPSTVSCLLEIDPKYKPAQAESIFKLLGKLNAIAQIFIDCLKSGKTNQENEVAAIIAAEIEKTFYIVDKAVKNINKNANQITIKEINSMPTNEAYRFLLSGLRFGYVDMKKKEEYAHFYSSTIPKGTPPTAKILRLSQELADLSSSLPCEHTNSIFVRCDKTRIDVIKILIMGSKDTPYSNGAFMFDLFCDDSYPNNPPKMSITTTGNAKIRFNPNLYQCGKVCLSLLGTWRGQASENWDAKISTLLQLFISTQGITMSEDLYFNEPGFDSEQGTVEGEKKNEAYANIVRIGNVRYAMIDQIKNPPKGFEDVVNRHFYVKKKQILEEIEKWIELADTKEASYVGLVNDHNTSWCTELKPKGKYKELLTKEYEELKVLLSNLPEPNLKQKEEEATIVEAQKTKKKVKAKEVKLGEIDVSYEPEAQKELIIEEGVMQDRWSRYIGAMGIEAVKKQAESKVILVGLKTLGLEIAKNLVLSGLKELCIVDQGIYGMGSEEHFYMSDVKSKKIEECVFKIKELNPYMLVKCQKEIPNLEGYNLVICTEPLQEAQQLSMKCRKSNVKFIHAQTSGVSGLYFADLGKDFSVQDPNGEEPFQAPIKEISCGQNGVVKLLDGIKHTYQDGDFIVLEKVEGMKEKESKMQEESYAQVFYNKMSKQTKGNTINGRVFQIKVINRNEFSIGDTTNYEAYVKGGLCKNINIPKKLQYSSLEDCVADFNAHLDPEMAIYDFEKMGDNYSIFACFQAYSQFVKKNGRKPKNWQVKDAEQFETLLKNILTAAKKTQQQMQSVIKFGRKFSLIAEAQVPVIGAYFGGLIAQQVVKAITNKYTPIKQFWTFHFNELAQQVPEQGQKISGLQIKPEEPFPNLKIVVGREGSKKIEQMKTFVIGAGAIGCELLKNFAMINMGAEGMITVTDPDHIETSNLTRQFLFRQKHVKKPKSATAAATLIQMNPFLKNHISARLDKVSQQTEDIYSDEFFDSQTVVANALDNVKARVYVDSRCVVNSKPLFESGTLGPKGHVQVIIPGKTENYGNQNDPTEENQIPHCTLKMFPQETVHCIEWSRDIFGKVFTLNPKALKKVIEAKDVSAAEGQEKTTISNMIEYKPSNFDDCVAEAVRKFYKYFRNNVRQLIHTYPLDMKTKDGNLFWTLPKRPPKQINQIDFTDNIHQKFIASYAVLLAKVYNLPFPKDFRAKEGIQNIIAIAKSIKPEQFVPSEEESKKLQKLTEKEEKKQQPEQNVMQEKQTQLNHGPAKEDVKIELTKQLLQLEIKPEQFEKDEDSNGHIDLIFAMSNLRSRNYGLNECTWIEAKLKAGKIMAALSTTTSVVAALQTIEIIKLVAGSKQYRNAFINLAIPLVQISEPGDAPKHKIGNTQFTVWDRWEFKANTMKDLLKQIEEKYDVEGYNISTGGGVPIYWQAMYVGKQEAAQQLLNRPLQKIFPEKTAVNILMRSKADKKPYEAVPRIVVVPPPQPQAP